MNETITRQRATDTTDSPLYPGLKRRIPDPAVVVGGVVSRYGEVLVPGVLHRIYHGSQTVWAPQESRITSERNREAAFRKRMNLRG